MTCSEGTVRVREIPALLLMERKSLSLDEKAPRLRERLFLGGGRAWGAPVASELLSRNRSELRSADGSETRPHTSIGLFRLLRLIRAGDRGSDGCSSDQIR